jgi:hypothetical protein
VKFGPSLKLFPALAICLLLLVTAACSPSNSANSTVTSQTSNLTDTPETPIFGSVVDKGIVTEHTGSNFTFDTNKGRLVIKFDSNTATEKIDPDSSKIVTGKINVNDLYPGTELLVDYYPGSNLAAKIVFTKFTLYTFISGTINDIFGTNIYLTTTTGTASKTLLMRFDYYTTTIIRADGSLGNIADLQKGVNIRIISNPGSLGAVVIEIQ